MFLRRICPVDPIEAEQLLQTEHADAVAMVVRNVDAIEALSTVTHAPMHDELARGLLTAAIGKSVMQLAGAEEVKLVFDTVDKQPSSSAVYQFPEGRRYFIADMPLPLTHEHMQRMVDDLVSSGHEYLASILAGGAFRYVDCEPVHGIADWTTSYHLDRTVAPSPELDNGPYPIYFHCETHRAGAVNFRLDDLRVQMDSGGPLAVSTLETPCQSAYWICVLSEAENMRLFHDTMKEELQRRAGEPMEYSIDDQRMPSISSIEPLLRAGVVLTLLEQRERELVVLQPGTPHMVLTPPNACKTSRNWMTPAALLGATCRVLRGWQGERAEWFTDLCQRPLRTLLPALRRLHIAEPAAFHQLACHLHTHTQLRFALGRTLALVPSSLRSSTLMSTDEGVVNELKSMVSHITALLGWPSPDSSSSSSSSSSSASSSQPSRSTTQSHFDSPLFVVADAAAAATPAAVTPASAAAAFAIAADASATIVESEHDLVACSRSFRARLFHRLVTECSLTSVVRAIDVVLVAKELPPTAEQLSLGLSSSVHEQTRMIEAAHRRRHPRPAKQVQLDATAHRVQIELTREYAKQARPLPTAYGRLVQLKERVQQLVPPAVTLSSEPNWYALHRRIRCLTPQDLQARRRLLQRDIIDFLCPVDVNQPPLIHAAPDSDSLMRWRALMFGPPDTPWQWVTIELRIDFPSDYPSSAPKITVVTPLFHPNVKLETGEICADGLTPGGWSPKDQLHGLLINLQSLLLEPNTASTLNKCAGELYEREQKLRAEREDQGGHAGSSVGLDITGPFWSEVYRVHRQNMQRQQPESQAIVPGASSTTQLHPAVSASPANDLLNADTTAVTNDRDGDVSMSPHHVVHAQSD